MFFHFLYCNPIQQKQTQVQLLNQILKYLNEIREEVSFPKGSHYDKLREEFHFLKSILENKGLPEIALRSNPR